MIRAHSLSSMLLLAVVSVACSNGGGGGSKPAQQQPYPYRYGMQPQPGMNPMLAAQMAQRQQAMGIDPALQQSSQGLLPTQTVRSQQFGGAPVNTNGPWANNSQGTSSLDSGSSYVSPFGEGDSKIDSIATAVPTGLSPDFDPNPPPYLAQNPPTNSQQFSQQQPAQQQQQQQSQQQPTTTDNTQPTQQQPTTQQPPTTDNTQPTQQQPPTQQPPTADNTQPPQQPAPPATISQQDDQQGADGAPVVIQVGQSSGIALEPQSITDSTWTPGVARAPVAFAKITGGVRSTDQAEYSDGKDDVIMMSFLHQIDVDPNMKTANYAFAAQIRDVHVTVDKTGQVTTYIDVAEDGNNLVQLDLFSKARAGARIYHLEPLSAVQSKFTYKATLMCMDIEIKSCQNAAVELQKLDANNAIVAKAFIVHRLGGAILVAQHVGNAKNANHQRFDKFVHQSITSVCVSEKQSAAKPELRKQLEAKCSAKEQPKDGAHQILMRTWAVAKGGSKFEVIFDEGKGENDPWFQSALTFSGQLVLLKDHKTNVATGRTETVLVDDRSPVKNHVSRANWFAKQSGVEMVNNDGGGDINLKFNFEGTPSESMRISVSSNLHKTIEPKMTDSAQQNPPVSVNAPVQAVANGPAEQNAVAAPQVSLVTTPTSTTWEAPEEAAAFAVPVENKEQAPAQAAPNAAPQPGDWQP